MSPLEHKRSIISLAPPIGIKKVMWDSVITNSSEPAIFLRYNQIRYNRVNLFTKITIWPRNLFVMCFVNNRVRYNRDSLRWVPIDGIIKNTCQAPAVGNCQRTNAEKEEKFWSHFDDKTWHNDLSLSFIYNIELI